VKTMKFSEKQVNILYGLEGLGLGAMAANQGDKVILGMGFSVALVAVLGIYLGRRK